MSMQTTSNADLYDYFYNWDVPEEENISNADLRDERCSSASPCNGCVYYHDSEPVGCVLVALSSYRAAGQLDKALAMIDVSEEVPF